MPNDTLKALAEKAGVSEKKAEDAWNKAKTEAKKEYPELNEDDDKFWKIVTGITKKMLGLKEAVVYDLDEDEKIVDEFELATHISEIYDVLVGDILEIITDVADSENNEADDDLIIDLDELSNALSDYLDVSVDEIKEVIQNFESDEESDLDENIHIDADFESLCESSLQSIPKVDSIDYYLELLNEEDEKKATNKNKDNEKEDKVMTKMECVEKLLSKKEFMPDAKTDEEREKKAKQVCSVAESKNTKKGK